MKKETFNIFIEFLNKGQDEIHFLGVTYELVISGRCYCLSITDREATRTKYYFPIDSTVIKVRES